MTPMIIRFDLPYAGMVFLMLLWAGLVLLGIWAECQPNETGRTGAPMLTCFLAVLMFCAVAIGYYSGSVYHGICK